MRVVKWLGCVSGRISQTTNSFGSDMAALCDADGHAYPDGCCDDDTLLPSERIGRKPVVQPAAPSLYIPPKRLTAGASV